MCESGWTLQFLVSISSSKVYHQNTAVVIRTEQISDMQTYHTISKTIMVSNKLDTSGICAAVIQVRGSTLKNSIPLKNTILEKY